MAETATIDLSSIRQMVAKGQLDLARKRLCQLQEKKGPTVETLRLGAGLAQRAGDLQEASEYLREALKLEPRSAQLLQDYARLLVKDGDLGGAGDHLEVALRLEPGNALLNLDFARVCEKLRFIHLAICHFRLALDLDPNLNEAAKGLKRLSKVPSLEPGLPAGEDYSRGLAAAGDAQFRRDFTESERLYRVLTAERNDRPEAFSRLGQMQLRAGLKMHAVLELARAAACRPEDGVLHANLSSVLTMVGLNGAALREAKLGARLTPDNPAVMNALGVALGSTGDLKRSAGAFRNAIQLEPKQAEFRFNLAFALRKLEQHEAALGQLVESVRLEPDNPMIMNSLAGYFIDIGRDAKAEKVLEKIFELVPRFPSAYLNRARLRLRTGNYLAAWKDLDWRFKVPGMANTKIRQFDPERRWVGASLRGRTILVWLDQGGSAFIQYLRFLLDLKALGATVLLETPAIWRQVFEASGLADQYPEPDSLHKQKFNAHVPLGNLPGILKTELNTIPAPIPYMRAPQDLKTGWGQKLAPPGRRLGITWAGNPLDGFDPLHSCPVEALSPLGLIPGLNWYALQVSRRKNPFHGAISLHSRIHNYNDLAAVLGNMDLLVSTDTEVAHLAAAMGVPVWLMLPEAADWPWPDGKTHSPWYPRVRIWRKNSREDWSSLVKRVAKALSDAFPPP